MAMVNMKMSKQEAEAEYSPAADEANLPKYPWGLSLHLGDDEIQKLGASGLKAGDEVMISCMAKVTGGSSSESLLGKTNNSIDLQITAMELGDEDDGGSAVAKTLYDKSQMK